MLWIVVLCCVVLCCVALRCVVLIFVRHLYRLAVNLFLAFVCLLVSLAQLVFRIASRVADCKTGC